MAGNIWGGILGGLGAVAGSALLPGVGTVLGGQLGSVLGGAIDKNKQAKEEEAAQQQQVQQQQVQAAYNNLQQQQSKPQQFDFWRSQQQNQMFGGTNPYPQQPIGTSGGWGQPNNRFGMGLWNQNQRNF